MCIWEKVSIFASTIMIDNTFRHNTTYITTPTTMKRLHLSLYLLTILLFSCTIPTRANDCLYTVSGNHLTPLCDTDISVSKEILTISLHDDGFAYVEVYYELLNKGEEKNQIVGFEAQPLEYDQSAFTPETGNPFIKDFTVVMNNSKIPYTINITKGKDFDSNDEIVMDYSYVYAFDARFKHGKNIVQHKYRYQTSECLFQAFDIAYKLTPATRWANGKIDDFTLIIKADNTAKHFFIPDSVFCGADFVVNNGEGKIRKAQTKDYGNITEVTIRNGSVCWKKADFCPCGELSILSADILFPDIHSKSYVLGSFYDRSEAFFHSLLSLKLDESKQIDEVIARNLPYASRGYVFKNLRLKRFFESQWWYMPDPNYVSTTTDFTPYEKDMLKMLKEK